MQGASLRVADDDVLTVERFQEGGRDLTGVGAGCVCGDILAPELDRKPIGRHQRLHRTQVSERREDCDLHLGEVVAGVLQTPGEFLHERDRLQVVEVHLPVAGDQRHAAARGHASHPSTSSPGRRLPSRNSRLAPPPVEMWPNWPSLNPSARTAAAESPPPTTESPLASVSASATARVPAAKASNSKTPIGPFQKTVADARIASAKRAAVCGPMSRPMPCSRQGVFSNESAAVTACSASAPNLEATTTSVGTSIVTPRRSASAR